MSDNRVFRLALLGIIAVGLIGVGGWLYLRPKSPAQLLQESKKYYEQGLQAFAEKNAAMAQLRFQEAKISADNALARIDREIEAAKKSAKPSTPPQVAEWMEIMARARYLKARALRDEAYAKGLADGKEIPEPVDSTTQKKFRSFMAIADDDKRNEAITALLQAAMVLPKEEELQIEALREEMPREPLRWTYTYQFANALHQLNPNDARALYLLARYDFEQPQIAKGAPTGPPTPLPKRSRSRVNEGLAYLAKIKEAKNYRVGQTLFLEAQMRWWLASDYERQNDNARADKERQKVVELLFDEKTGLLDKATTSEGYKNMWPWDFDGFLGAHLLAVQVAVEEHQKKDPAVEKVRQTLHATIAFCQRMEKDPVGALYPDRLAATTVSALSKAQSVLSVERGEDWQKSVEAGRALLKKSLAKEQAAPAVLTRFCSLVLRESVLAAKAGEKNRADDLAKEAMSWVKQGLDVAAKRKLAAKDVWPLHALAADLEFMTGAKSQDLEPRLKALADAKAPGAESVAHLLRGAIQEREGRLERARRHFEKALDSDSPDVAVRANMALANVYMAVGEPAKALVCLQRLDKIYERFDELTPQERAWAQQFLRGADDLAVLQSNAYLESARRDIANFVRERPGQLIPAGFYEDSENAVETLLKKMPPQKKQALQIRETLIRYFATTGRMERAEKELTAALNEHPNSASLLQLDVTLLLTKARGKPDDKLSKEQQDALTAKVDRRIEDFNKKFDDRAARLFWVSWLAQTDRNEQALAYLKDSANFPGVKDDAYNRMLAIVLAASGNRQETTKLLAQLPHDPLVDHLVIQMAATNQAKRKSVKEALARYESNGLFRVWDAGLMLEDKRYPEAAQAFFNALDFTRVRSHAAAGLQRALIALASDKPAEARKMAEDMLNDYPEEPALLLPLAVALQRLDEVGQPADVWANTRTMGSALNAWEQAVLKTNPDRLTVAMTRAELWFQSNQPEFARAEALRALGQAPEDRNALGLAIGLDLLFPTEDRLADAKGLLITLQKVAPGAVTTLLAEARIDAAQHKNDQAIAVLGKLLDKHPNASAAYELLVKLQNDQKQPAQALQTSQVWLEKNPDNLAAATNLVTQLCLAKRLPDARKTADGFTDARVKELAKRLAERTFENDENPEKTRRTIIADQRWAYGLHFAKAFLAAEETKEAQARLQQLLGEKPNHVDALLNLGHVHLKRQDWKQCVAVYGEVLKHEKGNFVAGNNLAFILATQLKDPGKALEILRSVSVGRFSGKALPGDRLHPEVLDTLGTIYQKLYPTADDLHGEMAQVFEAAQKRYRRDARMYYYLGLAYAGLKENAKAAQMFQSAIALAKDAGNAATPQGQRAAVIRDAEARQKRLTVK